MDHKQKLLFSQEVEIDTSQLKKWEPEIIIDRRTFQRSEGTMKYRTGPDELERLCRLPDALGNLKGMAVDLRAAQQRIQELEETLAAILGWRERDRNDMGEVMQYIEQRAHNALKAVQAKEES